MSQGLADVSGVEGYNVAPDMGALGAAPAKVEATEDVETYWAGISAQVANVYVAVADLDGQTEMTLDDLSQVRSRRHSSAFRFWALTAAAADANHAAHLRVWRGVNSGVV